MPVRAKKDVASSGSVHLAAFFARADDRADDAARLSMYESTASAWYEP